MSISAPLRRLVLCGCLLTAGLALPIAAPGLDDDGVEDDDSAADDGVTGDGREIVWRERFVTWVPDGWQVVTDEFSANTQATPDGIPSRATLMTSPDGIHLLSVFVDGRAISLALGSQTLFQLTEAWLEGFLLTRSRPLARTEPWKCDLDVPTMTPVFGGRAYTRRLGVPDIDRPTRDDGRSPVWVCASREVKSGAFVLVLGWVDDDQGEIADPERVVAEMTRVMVRSGLRPVPPGTAADDVDTPVDAPQDGPTP